MKKFFLALFAIFTLAINTHAAEIDATLEVVKKFGSLPNILVQHADSNYSQKEMSLRIFRMLIADLKVTGHFSVSQSEQAVNPAMVMNFDEYRQSKIDLIARIVAEKAAGSIKAKLQLYDANSGTVALSREYTVTLDAEYPFIAHKMAIDINAYIKAPAVDWLARKVVLSHYGRPGVADIIVADYTLTYRQSVVSNGSLNIFPKWANDAQDAIFFTRYLNAPTLFSRDLKTGVERQIAQSNGMLVVSDVSSDGSKLLVTMAPNEQPDIYLLNLTNGATTQLTRYSGIDVSGNFIEDEQRVMFISDRLGYPNVFAIPASGETTGKVEQLVFHGKNNNAAHAHGNYIVYSSRESGDAFANNTFNLYLVSTKSDFIRRLSSNGVNQIPRFSKDGETIMYIKHEGNQSALGIIRLNYNKTLLFPLKGSTIQSMDW